jgi:hypothetical protein
MGAVICGEELVAEALRSSFGGVPLLGYWESDDEIRFRVPGLLRDTQSARAFRSQMAVLDELAVSHRLSVLLGRRKCGLAEDCALAMATVDTVVHGIDPVDGCHVSLRLEATLGGAKRPGAQSALRSTLVTRHGTEAHTSQAVFNVLPPAFASFVRRTRGFMDFAHIRMSRDEALLVGVADNHLRYFPSEHDRLSDGRRVDHVPGLTLLDIALFASGSARGDVVSTRLSAEFPRYTDPRLAFDIVMKGDRVRTELVQNEALVALVCHHVRPRSRR